MDILKIFRWTIFCWTILATREMLAESIVVQHRRMRSLTMNVKKGATTVLKCNVTATDQTTGHPPPHVIEWFHQGFPVFIKVGKHPPHVNPDFTGRISMLGGNVLDASLRIDDVREDDDGWYECRVLFLRDKFEKSSNGTWIRLVVTEPPAFNVTPPPTVVSNQGQSLVLKCRATGRPAPVITWRKGTRIVRDGQNGIRLSGSDLAVTSLNASHRGMYTCKAISVEGQIQFTTTVYVKAPPVITRKPTDTTAKEGQNAMFTCKAEGYPTEITYRWSYNGISVEKSSDLRGRYSAADGTLLIDNVTPEDKGIVTCTANNGFGIAPSASASISVQFSARVSGMPALVYAGLGLKAILHCPSSAKPPVNTVEWKKNGDIIFPQQNPRISLNENGSLIISSTNSRDSGRFTCTPYNNLGTLGESTGTRLIIRDPPYFTYAPKSSYEVVIGEPLEIPCQGGGDPPPAITWRKISTVTPSPKLEYSVFAGNLVVQAITKEYHGTWECVLANTVAEVTTRTKIQVKYTSPHKVSNVTAQALSNDAVRVSWSPGYNGGYPQRFVIWYKPAHKGANFWKTFYVEDDHTSAVVDHLQAVTTYEFAVLPENALRSGPFSDTIATKTLLVRSPTPEKDLVMLTPPQALFASKTKDGLLQLSWRKPKTGFTAKAQTKIVNDGDSAPEPYAGSLYTQKLKGFLIEFRWIRFDQPSSKGRETMSERIAARKQRSVTSNDKVHYKTKRYGSEIFAQKLMNHVTRSKRTASLPEKEVWKTLTTTLDNVTTVVVPPKKVYRDILYEFRVLAMSQHDYSLPSNPVRVSTKGLPSYPCFITSVNTGSVMGDGVVAGVVLGTCFIVFVCIFGILCYCKRRKRTLKQGFKSGHQVDKSEQATLNYTSDQQPNPRPNGTITNAKQPTVVDLTNGGSGGYGTMEKREFEALVDDNVKSSFIGDDINRDKSFSSFGDESSTDDGTRNKNERSGSDRSSVRLRRQKVAQILFTQLKRRSMTEHLYSSARREIHPLRGGIRSASTSPERTANLSFLHPPDRLNVTSPAAIEMPRLRRKIRLYSRPIKDSDTGQHRKMIVIKRKSQRSSISLTNERGRSCRAPPSDSSESPVFGVIGTSVNPGTCSSPILSESAETTCQRQCSFSPQPNSPVDDEVFSSGDFNNRDTHGDELVRNLQAWESPITKPLLASSPKDTSPKRVIERRTVTYDPSLERPFRHCSNPNKNTFSSPERGVMDRGHSERYNSLKSAKERASPWRRPPDKNLARYAYSPQTNTQQIPMSYAMDLASRSRSPSINETCPESAFMVRPRRYSFAQRPVAYHIPPQHALYHQRPSTPIGGCSYFPNSARTRASYSFGHQPFTLLSPANVPERPPSPQCNISMQRSNPQASTACLHPLQSTLEIDCSNSDIEVRFVKDRNGNEFLVNPNLIDPYHDVVTRDSVNQTATYSNRIPQGYGRCSTNPHQTLSPVPIMTPDRNVSSLENDLRCNQRVSSSDNRPVEVGRRSSSTSPTKCIRKQSPHQQLPAIDTHYASSDTATMFHPVMMPHLLSPSRSTPTLPTRLKIKTGGAAEQPTSPPLNAVGSSGYGSQDTSNSSASPSAQLNPLNVSTSPIHARVFGLSQERPPRRDNSSVEDNYEWDSEIAMESEILEALRHFGTLKKSGPVSDELMDELSKFTKDTKTSALQSTLEDNQRGTEERNESTTRPSTSDADYTKESMARRCAALRAEFLHYQQLQQLDENKQS